MSATPNPASPSLRTALLNRTNTCAYDTSEWATQSSQQKRPLDVSNGRDTKRAKLAPLKDSGTWLDDSDSDVSTDGPAVTRDRTRKRMTFSMRNAAMMAHTSALSRSLSVASRSILQTFVSCHRTDVFKCYAVNGPFNTVPYVCSFTNEAKRGGLPLLAVATEQGSVHVVNTAKRKQLDCEPQRVVFSPHQNGIFDAKWSPSDTLLATAAGDFSTRISSLASSVSSENRVLHVLRGHEGTVKSIAWNPARNGDILATGGRDGEIRIWDLRVGEGRDQRSHDGTCPRDVIANRGAIAPVIVINRAHEVNRNPMKPRFRKGKVAAEPARSVTSVLYAPNDPTCIVSSGSYDGIIRRWDLRLPPTDSKIDAPFGIPNDALSMSSTDPTTNQGTRRARGITSLVLGEGPTAGLLFALGNDSRVHTYAMQSLEPLSGFGMAQDDPWAYSHGDMQTNSFYVRLALSPCGRWLASGNASAGRVFLFDVGSTASSRSAVFRGYDREATKAVKLNGQSGEVGALDWAHNMLATCADDTTVRIWRPDVDVHKQCMLDSKATKYDWSWAEDN